MKVHIHMEKVKILISESCPSLCVKLYMSMLHEKNMGWAKIHLAFKSVSYRLNCSYIKLKVLHL